MQKIHVHLLLCALLAAPALLVAADDPSTVPQPTPLELLEAAHKDAAELDWGTDTSFLGDEHRPVDLVILHKHESSGSESGSSSSSDTEVATGLSDLASTGASGDDAKTEALGHRRSHSVGSMSTNSDRSFVSNQSPILSPIASDDDKTELPLPLSKDDTVTNTYNVAGFVGSVLSSAVRKPDPVATTAPQSSPLSSKSTSDDDFVDELSGSSNPSDAPSALPSIYAFDGEGKHGELLVPVVSSDLPSASHVGIGDGCYAVSSVTRGRERGDLYNQLRSQMQKTDELVVGQERLTDELSRVEGDQQRMGVRLAARMSDIADSISSEVRQQAEAITALRQEAKAAAENISHMADELSRVEGDQQKMGERLAARMSDMDAGIQAGARQQAEAITALQQEAKATAANISHMAGDVDRLNQRQDGLNRDLSEVRAIAETSTCLGGIIDHVQKTVIEMQNLMPQVAAGGLSDGDMLVVQSEFAPVVVRCMAGANTYVDAGLNALVVKGDLNKIEADLLKASSIIDSKQDKIPAEQLVLLQLLTKYGPTALKTGLAYGISSEFALIEHLAALLTMQAQDSQGALGNGSLLLDIIRFCSNNDCAITSALLNGVRVNLVDPKNKTLSLDCRTGAKNGACAWAVSTGAEYAVDALAQSDLGKRLNIAQKVKNVSNTAKGVAFTVATTLVQTHIADRII